MKNKYQIIGIVLLSGILLTGCSGEESLDPSNEKEEYFSVPDDQNDDISQSRRAFYEKTGAHVLFNDTLRKDHIGKDANGDDIWDIETIDFSYNMTSYSVSKYRFQPLAKEKRIAAIQFVEDLMTTHLQKASQITPYSILLASSFEIKDGVYSDWAPITGLTVSCMRCLGIAIEDVSEMTDEEKSVYKKQLLLELISSRFSESDARLNSFNDYTKNYYTMGYSGYVSDYVENWSGNMNDIYALGFLSYESGWYADTFPSLEDDLKDYLHAVLEQSPEEFQSTYHDFPIVLERYTILKNLLVELGVKL